jgi:flagellar basal body P-ring protein FlgI
MHRILTIFFLLYLSSPGWAEPIAKLASVQDGLEYGSEENLSDDYIRLDLYQASYQTASNIQTAVTNWLGPDMVIIKSNEQVLIQAPRDSSKRIEFITALLLLEI